MKKLTLYGKVNVGLGIVLFILGLFLFTQKYEGSFIFQEQYLSLSFIFLGSALILASYLAKKKHS
ncbi:hypothetical protein [Ornithinibacillus halotolerans]|uniref:Uncharacterized protein n=1 Tax=Ornithinibacillus halotolerans TaxID=1274357 RepID=A0A916RTV7_9BACI|nr:hypothetical protein [Ornithinibacillus halotolerans]GGA70021.1 hypothetical protein GCM10008025_12470 [Ornithinibacillus halotolerans]